MNGNRIFLINQRDQWQFALIPYLILRTKIRSTREDLGTRHFVKYQYRAKMDAAEGSILWMELFIQVG